MSKEQFRAGEQTRQAINFQSRVVDEENRVIEYIGSNQSIDRYKTRLSGWKLGDYKRNPVFLWSHNYSMPPIGRALGVREDKKTGELKFQVQYAPRSIYPFAGTIYDMVKEGYLNAVSVGFSPGKVEFNEDEDIHELRDNDLMELSQVPVPANPEALVNAFSRGVVPEGHQGLFAVNTDFADDNLDGVRLEALCADVRSWIEEQDGAEIDSAIELASPLIDLVPDTPQLNQKEAESLSENTDANGTEDNSAERDPEGTDGASAMDTTEVELKNAPTLDVSEEISTENLPENDQSRDVMEGVSTESLPENTPADTPSMDPEVRECLALGALSLIADCVDVTFSSGRGNYSELVQAVQERVGAVLNRKNQAALEKAGELIREVIESAAAEPTDQGDEPTVQDVVDGRMAEIERAIGRLGDKIDDASQNTVAQTLISRRAGADTALDGVLTKLEKLGRR